MNDWLTDWQISQQTDYTTDNIKFWRAHVQYMYIHISILFIQHEVQEIHDQVKGSCYDTEYATKWVDLYKHNLIHFNYLLASRYTGLLRDRGTVVTVISFVLCTSLC